MMQGSESGRCKLGMKSAMDDWGAGRTGAVMDDFDVFLSHRGPDVKATFVAHLYEALRCAGFRPFVDARSLMKGDPALKSIDQALDMVKVHVAVVSRGYAESKYCLTELVAMMKSGKPVVPVFYDVEPADLRWVENGPFAEAFEKHKRKGRTEKKVQEWRDALRALAELTGFRLADYESDEAQLKREVVIEVARLAPSNDPVDVEYFRVGLEGPTSSCVQALENMGAGTGILGLVGMGGVGKTTLAREVYNHFAAHKRFKCMTFLEIHRDSSSSVQVRPTWSRKLRKQLLVDLLSVQESTSNYSSWFQKVSILGPVLIVIDDVHKLGQFEELIPSTSLLHPGSRILLTSRDRSVLNCVFGRAKVDHHLYDVSTLGWEESNMLFNWHAFNVDEAPLEFQDVAKDVVKACGGLPLALKVIGSSIFDKRSDEDKNSIWPEAVDALRQSKDVMGVLRWSYDNLSDLEKLMFVDVTCLFYDRSVKEALAYWTSCTNCTSCGGVKTPHTALRNLVDRNMVEQNHWELRVHDLLRDLGQEIGREAKSHVVDGVFAEATVTKNQGMEKTMALNLAASRKRKFDAESFANMPNLHFLKLPNGCSVDGDFRCISRELRLLQWRGMPFARVPTKLNLSHLLSLDFSDSTNLASLWTESNSTLEGCPNLTQLNLERCTSITKLPDSIAQSSQLQYLTLAGCESLRKFPKSIGQLKALRYLILSECRSLKALPDTIGTLPELQSLHAHDCTSLVKLPTSIGLLSSLQYLEITASTECQMFSDGYIGEAWTRLRNLHIKNCGGLGSLLDYAALKSLEQFDLTSSTLTELPESLGVLIRLRSLRILSSERLQCLPNSIGDLKMLETLYLRNCESLQCLPNSIGDLKMLETLYLRNCESLQCLPNSIGDLKMLETLYLRNCESLQCLPNSIGDLKMLETLYLSNCESLKKLPKTLGALTSLKELSITCCPVRRLPKSLGQLSQLNLLKMRGCKNLQKLPASIRQLGGLNEFHLEECRSIEAMGALTALQGLPIWGSTSITTLPASFGVVSDLSVVYEGNTDEALDARRDLHDDASQVLDEDESGFLGAYYSESTGLTGLLRWCDRKISYFPST